MLAPQSLDKARLQNDTLVNDLLNPNISAVMNFPPIFRYVIRLVTPMPVMHIQISQQQLESLKSYQNQFFFSSNMQNIAQIKKTKKNSILISN